jgi:glutamate-ammonia-ligase adenylyltransferase
MLQLKYGRHNRLIRIPNTLPALAALHETGQVGDEDFSFLTRSYRFLHTLEGRLRLMNFTARDRLPEDPKELVKLAHLLHYSSGDALLADFDKYTRQTRERFDRIFDAERT